MQYFLGCDWGTSFLRLWLADAASYDIIAEEGSPQGIKAVYALWKEQGMQDDSSARIIFYLQFIRDLIRKIETKLGIPLNHVPLIISGMASSSIGIKELPYRQLPFAIDGSDAITEYIEAIADFEHPVWLVSGVRNRDDVMRGEETQLVGCLDYLHKEAGERLFVFPGTHSKHIVVKDSEVRRFSTYMTGEFFELVSQKSILHTGLEPHLDIQYPVFREAFMLGVKEAVTASLLRAAFRARTNSLFNKLSKKENYSYLSGVFIGSELKNIDSSLFTHIYICADGKLAAYYELAGEALGIGRAHILPPAWVEQSAIRGQIKIFNHLPVNKQ